MSFSEKLKDVRTERGMSQKTLADAANVSQAAIYQWEKGTRTPKIEQVTKLALALGVSNDYLLGYSEYKEVLINDNPVLAALKGSKNKLGEDLLKQIEIDALDMTEEKCELIYTYNKLNEIGQKEARKRVQELTEIPRYQK